MDADARVNDGDGRAPAIAGPMRRLAYVDAQSAAVGHGLDGIADEVEKNLASNSTGKP